MTCSEAATVTSPVSPLGVPDPNPASFANRKLADEHITRGLLDHPVNAPLIAQLLQFFHTSSRTIPWRTFLSEGRQCTVLAERRAAHRRL